MPDYVFTAHYVDAQDGETMKSFQGTFADYATAQTNVTNLLNALQNASNAQIDYYTLAEKTIVAGAPNAGSTVFERVSATVNLAGGAKKANVNFPSPVDAIMSGNALDPAATEWTAIMAQFVSPLWTVSDGEYIASTVSGKRVYTSSGSTNLPS